MEKTVAREGFPAEPDVFSAFAPCGDLFRTGVGLLYERLAGHAHAGPRLSRPANAALARLASRRCSPAVAEEPARFLLAVETYYALIVKLATFLLLVRDGRKCPPAVFGGRGSWRDTLRCMESGQLGASLGVRGFPEAPQFAWYLDAWEHRLDRWADDAVGALATDRLAGSAADPAAGADLFGGLYQALLPKQVRHGLGEHYTPAWLADHVLDRVGFDGRSAGRILDPTCGSGIFLLRAIRRLRDCARRAGGSPLDLITGFDVNPLAVLTTKANCLLAVRDRIAAGDGPAAAPVFCRDVVQGAQPNRLSGSLPLCRSEPSADSCRFDYVVGNPPWLCWDLLASDDRRKTKRLWEEYGLFSLSGSAARHGGGKKDLAMLVLYASADQFLREGGRLGMVVTQTLFQTRGAGDGFRRFRLGADGAPLAVLRVDDMVDIRPFATAANWTATIALEKGRATRYPVPYVRWTRPEAAERGDARPAGNRFHKQRLAAEPIDPARRQSPWFVRPVDLGVPVGRLVGPSDYTAHLGANTGGANGVYWVEVAAGEGDAVLVENLSGLGKQAYPTIRSNVEPDLLHPLIRWADVSRYRAAPSACLLLAQDPTTRRGIDEETMQEKYPRTYAYLRRFERQLQRRAAYRRYQRAAPFYSMYNVGRYTVADHKVVWRRMDRRIRAAAVGPAGQAGQGSMARQPGRAVVCQETCVLIATRSKEEAHYLAALMNSAVVDFLVGSHNVRGGKGFGSPGMLEYLNLRTYDRGDAVHRQLAALSRLAHRAASLNRDFEQIQARIDSAAARLYGLCPADARAIASLAGRAGR
ncbi:MAG: N-6 DNA methylase [Planctomycetota bacterium]|nr:N-6 DNA methylase [Planctomycetota bacterium]